MDGCWQFKKIFLHVWLCFLFHVTWGFVWRWYCMFNRCFTRCNSAPYSHIYSTLSSAPLPSRQHPPAVQSGGRGQRGGAVQRGAGGGAGPSHRGGERHTAGEHSHPGDCQGLASSSWWQTGPRGPYLRGERDSLDKLNKESAEIM